jgi:hypothetical protein
VIQARAIFISFGTLKIDKKNMTEDVYFFFYFWIVKVNLKKIKTADK